MSETVSAPFRGVDLGLPATPITLADAPASLATSPGRSPGAVLVDIPEALSRQSIVVSQWAIAANLVIARLLAQLSAPTNLIFSLSGSSHTAFGTSYFVVSAANLAGETTPSNEIAIPNNGQIRTLSWDAVPGATHYNLYQSSTGASGGEYISPAFVGSTAATSWTAPPAPVGGTAPTANSTYSPSAAQQFGRLGRLLGGPLRHKAVQTTGTGISAALVAPWETPFMFPDDISNLATLWDGSTDASPPIEAWDNPMPVNIATTLNSPIALSAGEQLGILLGLTPIVGQNLAVYVVNGRWSLTYDRA